MPETMELTDLDVLIEDLDQRITDSNLPTPEAFSGVCSANCTSILACTVLC